MQRRNETEYLIRIIKIKATKKEYRNETLFLLLFLFYTDFTKSGMLSLQSSSTISTQTGKDDLNEN